MADPDKSKTEQAAKPVAEWLARSEERFRQGSVNDDDLADALGLSAEEVTEGVDYLENREEVVRFPHPMKTPPRVKLKPGRGWQELRDEIAGEGAGSPAPSPVRFSKLSPSVPVRLEA
jgi:hypothetical protein